MHDLARRRAGDERREFRAQLCGRLEAAIVEQVVLEAAVHRAGDVTRLCVERLHLAAKALRRAREAGETQGFMKALVDADTDRLLGAAILGLNGDEVVHALLDAMAADRPVSPIARTMHIHPTVSELLPTLLQQLKPLGAA